MWHASVSLAHKGRLAPDEATCERVAVDALRGVGGSFEWWKWNTAANVGHLRIPVTDDEAALIPPGQVVMDAGDEGTRRSRTP